MVKLYVVTVDYYTEDEGFKHEIVKITDNKKVAITEFNTLRDILKKQDKELGWTVMDNHDTIYFSHGKMPEYCRLLLTEYKEAV